MKETFYWVMGICGVVAVVGYLGYRVYLAFGDMFQDWQAGREAAQLKQERARLAEQRQEENAKRLDNDCEHVFDDRYGALPPDVCSKCGLARDKPAGACDHIWRVIDGPTPSSQCEKCGRKHGGTQQAVL